MKTKQEIEQKIKWYEELMEKECLKPNAGRYEALWNAVQELKWTLRSLESEVKDECNNGSNNGGSNIKSFDVGKY